jgi:S-adenosylmethionine/arginine decarboxylase-like enzyme
LTINKKESIFVFGSSGRTRKKLETVLQHKHLIIRAEVENPPKDTDLINEWMKNLVDKIGMKILMGPYSVYSNMVGNQGLTAVTIIETSHIAMHVWDAVSPGLMEFDVYTCSTLNPQDILDEMEQFSPTKIEYFFIDRENTLTVLEEKKVA